MRKVTMQRRHFELIAHVIKWADIDPIAKDRVARDFERALRATNANFDGERFLEATINPADRKAAE